MPHKMPLMQTNNPFDFLGEQHTPESLRASCKKKKAKPSYLEADFAHAWKMTGLPKPESEYVIKETGRKWKYDFAWPERKIAVEIHGGVWTQGRHTRGAGFIGDRRKMNAAVLCGWRVLEFTTDCLKKRMPEVIEQVKQILGEPQS
jgi:hypothetical protein